MLRTPQNDAQLRATRAEIAWQSVSGAARYQLQIATDNDFSHLVADEKELRGTAYLSGALTTGNYFVRLRALEADAGPNAMPDTKPDTKPDAKPEAKRDVRPGAWSAVRRFTVLQLGAPALRKIVNADKGWDFAWDQPEQGLTCQIQLARDPGFGTLLLDQTQLLPELHLKTALEPGTYYLRVRGIDAERHAGSFSEVAQFVVEKPARFPYEFLGVGAILLMFLL
jgi:hypothetical protein